MHAPVMHEDAGGIVAMVQTTIDDVHEWTEVLMQAVMKTRKELDERTRPTEGLHEC